MDPVLFSMIAIVCLAICHTLPVVTDTFYRSCFCVGFDILHDFLSDLCIVLWKSFEGIPDVVALPFKFFGGINILAVKPNFFPFYEMISSFCTHLESGVNFVDFVNRF